MITIVLFAACFAFFMTEVARWQEFRDWFYGVQPFNRKPLNCIPCLAAWTGWLAALLDGQKPLHSLFAMFLSGVAGIVLYKALSRM